MMCSSCRMRAFSSATMWPSLLTVVIFFSFAMLPGDFGTKIILFGESASGGASPWACPNPRTEVLGDDWEGWVRRGALALVSGLKPAGGQVEDWSLRRTGPPRVGGVRRTGPPRASQGLPGPPRVETLGYDWEEVVSPLGCSGKRTEVRGIGAPVPQCCMSAKKIRYMASCIEAMPRSGL